MIWFLGDVHGRFDHVIRLVKIHRPKAVIFLGDLECSLPLDVILRPIVGLTEIWFIHGNHDVDEFSYWENLYGSGLSERSLHGRVVEIAGYRIGGLGGTFEPPVWRPGSPDQVFKATTTFLSVWPSGRSTLMSLQRKNSTRFRQFSQTTIFHSRLRARTF